MQSGHSLASASPKPRSRRLEQVARSSPGVYQGATRACLCLHPNMPRGHSLARHCDPIPRVLDPIMSARAPEHAQWQLSCKALRSHSSSAGAYSQAAVAKCARPLWMCRAIIAGQQRQIQPTPLWLAAVAEGRLLAARVTQEVWGHAELLRARRACCWATPAAVLSHQPQLQHTSLVPAALPADRRCPSWSPMLSTLPAWLAVRLVPDPAS